MEKIANLLIYGGAVAGAGAFGYKMVQKGRQKAVPTSVNALMYVGVGALAIGIAVKMAMGKKPSIA